MSGKYDDIMNLPHHVSDSHPHMPVADRAAQFAPFAALTGYDAVVRETARLTDRRLELDESEKEALNKKLTLIAACLHDEPVASISYFLPDNKKSGGAYVTETGPVKKLDAYARVVIMKNGRRIPIDEIIKIESSIFR